MLANWEAKIIKLLETQQYNELIQHCEQAINNNEQGCLPYWYLGLAYLLQQQSEEAQAIWLSGWFEAPGEETSEQRTQQLATILEREAQRQAAQEAFSISAAIREQLQEIQPENLNNDLQLIKILISNKAFSSDLLEQWEFISRLEAVQEIDEELLKEVVGLLLVNFPSTIHTSLVKVAFSKSQDQVDFLRLLVSSAIELAYNHFKKKSAIAVLELCKQLDSNFQLNLKYLANIYCEIGDYQKAIETSQNFLENTDTLLEKVEGNRLLLKSLLAAGNWREVLKIITDYKEQLQELAENITENTGEEEVSFGLPVAAVYLNYIEDKIQQNRFFQNEIGKLIQAQFINTVIQHNRPNHSNKKYLRIGYIAHTLRSHSVGWLSRWLIGNHHRYQFHVTIYLIDGKPDHLTRKLAETVDHFRQLNLSCFDNAQRIADDEIDILIDLDSCTYTKTYKTLALKPAPIQVTWLGWDASGIPAIDYYLADPYVLPENAQEYYQETIWRLPNSYVAVAGFEVDVPTLTREKLEIPPDAIVYFSSQAAKKRHPDTVHLQMRILKAVPNSYLLIKGKSDQELLANFFNDIAEAEGVDPQRLRFLDRDPNEYIHRANLSIADVVLDTYPYNGATTTLETLWMGIPLVTRVGEQYVARNSYTFLKNAGVEEGIAWTDEEYIEWGIKFGTDENLRRDVHCKLLESRQTSPLWNVEQFVDDVETAYKQMWEKYVQQVSTDAVSYPVASEAVENQSQPPKEKPTIRLLHNLPKCGGTQISKCLATMKKNLLLSEIHPRSMEMYNPLQQAHEWFDLLSIKDLNEFATLKPVSFVDAILLIHKRSQERNRNLIIRDWAHLDFLGVPWTNNLSYRLDLAEALKPHFNLVQAAIVRHPVDQWLDLSRLKFLQGKLTLDSFLKGYLEFAKIVSQMNFIRYEDYRNNPNRELQKLCQALQTPFDVQYQNKWEDYKTITGEITNDEDITPQTRDSLKAEILETIEKNEFYQEAVDLLGYREDISLKSQQQSASKPLTLNLHIGGKQVHPDWKILNIESRPEVDYVGDAANLSMFESDSVDTIYTSHTLEHFYYGINNELLNTLKEWNRVLKPEGKIMISVPDLKVLSRLYLREDIKFEQRFHIMRMMFGGQTSIYDVHKVGFDFDTLKAYLQEANFKDVERVEEFNIFNDSSSLKYLGTLISLNVIAYKS